MADKKILDYIIESGIYKSLSKIPDSIGKVIDALKNWRINRMLDPEQSKEENPLVQTAEEINGVKYTEVSLKEHEHSEYYKKNETVEKARSVKVGDEYLTPEMLAPIDHEHPEYVKKGEAYIGTLKLGDRPASDFALKDHEHAEYFKVDEPADIADIIGGVSPNDLADINHRHETQYYQFDETVQNAMNLIDLNSNAVYSENDLAPAEHEHPEYFTREEFYKFFMLKDEPYYFSKTFNIELYKLNYSGGSIEVNSDSGLYDVLQSPFVELGLKPEASVNAGLNYIGNATAIVYAMDFSVSPGKYYTVSLSLPFSGKIRGIFANFKSVPASDKAPNQMPVFIGWSGDQFAIYGMNFWNTPNMPITGKLFIIYELNYPDTTVDDLIVREEEEYAFGYAPKFIAPKRYDLPLKAAINIPIKYAAYPNVEEVEFKLYGPNSTSPVLTDYRNSGDFVVLVPSTTFNAEGKWTAKITARNKIGTSVDTITFNVQNFKLEEIELNTQTLIFSRNEGVKRKVKYFISDPFGQFDLDISASGISKFTLVNSTPSYNGDKMGWEGELEFNVLDVEGKIKETAVVKFTDTVSGQTQEVKINLYSIDNFEIYPERQILLDEYVMAEKDKLFIPLSALARGNNNELLVFDLDNPNAKGNIIEIDGLSYYYVDNITTVTNIRFRGVTPDGTQGYYFDITIRP
jgi:hypothetical protein